VTEIAPEAGPLPIDVGAAKLPVASESCTVNVLPEPKAQAFSKLLVMLKVFPWHIGELTVGALIPSALIVKAALAALVITGLELTTCILYPAPAAAVNGIVTEIEPPEVDDVEPTVVGEAKLPAASDICTVKVFPEPNVQALANVFVMLNVDPAQNGEPVTVGALIPKAVIVNALLAALVKTGFELTT